jgi:hypothetical protein
MHGTMNLKFQVTLLHIMYGLEMISCAPTV